jgi:integrase
VHARTFFSFAATREQFAVFCSHVLSRINRPASLFSTDGRTIAPMIPALFDQRGNRKYLIARERLAFVRAASKERDAVSTFCLTPAFTGARISEVLALTANRIDTADEAIIFETLKQRKKQIFRAMPVPRSLIPLLSMYVIGKEGRLWPWGRTNETDGKSSRSSCERPGLLNAYASRRHYVTRSPSKRGRKAFL